MRLSPWLRECLYPIAIGQRITRPLLLAAWLLSGQWVARSYQRLLAAHGLSPYALAERDDEKTDVFYDHLFQNISLGSEISVLDIGCGLGDLIAYIESRGTTITRYLGLDLVDTFVQECRNRYASPYEFSRQNFIDPGFQPEQRFGLVVNLGCLVSRVYAYEEYVAFTCAKMMRYAQQAVLFNVITAVESSSPAYSKSSQIGQTTTISKTHLLSILDKLTQQSSWKYTFHDVSIYPDATDTFVYIYQSKPEKRV